MPLQGASVLVSLPSKVPIWRARHDLLRGWRTLRSALLHFTNEFRNDRKPHCDQQVVDHRETFGVDFISTRREISWHPQNNILAHPLPQYPLSSLCVAQ